MWAWACRSIFSLTFFAPALFAEQKIPALSAPVIDQAGLLNTAEVESLSRLLKSFQPKIQMQIWTIKSLEGEAIESLSIRATDQWKLGSKKADNGVLILVAQSDRQMRIEVGQGLEGEIPDVLAGRIINQILGPAFKSGDYAGGLASATQFIYKKATGEPVPELKDERRRREDNFVPLIFGFFFIFIGLINLFSRAVRGSRGGPPGWGGGFSGGGWGSGGGGWSGGGGGFSGGGSSGRW